jgi:S1-C subfamily serine protease
VGATAVLVVVIRSPEGSESATVLPALPVIAKFPAPVNSVGLTFFGGDVWLSDGYDVYDVGTDGTGRGSYAWPGNQLRALGADGESLWADDAIAGPGHTEALLSFAIDGGQVKPVATVAVPRRPAGGEWHELSADGSRFWWSVDTGALLLNRDGTIARQISRPRAIRGLEWDGHRLWIATDADDGTSSIEVADESGKTTTTFTVAIRRIRGLAFGDGSLWAIGYEPKPPFASTLYRLDASKADSPAVRRLTISGVASRGGSRVTSSPAGIRCGAVCTATFPLGSTVTLTAAPAAGYAFGGWRGPCSPRPALACTTVLNDVSTVAAAFQPIVTVTRRGDGTITGSPPVVACGSRCSGSVAVGTTLKLTAAPVTGSFFAGWSGACAGRALTCLLRVRHPMDVVAPFRRLTDLEKDVVQLSGLRCASGAAAPALSFGTGITLGDRLIATVDHVVANLREIDVLTEGKVVARASIIGRDPDRDVALLRSDRALPGAGRQAIAFASRLPHLGEEVAAIGYTPDAPPNVTLTTVTGTNVPFRVANVPGLKRLRLLQLRAPVNPGTSGGLLVSSQTGEVLGIVDMRTTTGTGNGYAVSAAVAKPLIAAWSRAPQPPPATRCD